MPNANPTRPFFLENGHLVPKRGARVALLPVPYESTVSYGGGTARGPAAILVASQQLELLDEQCGAEPHTCGVWTEAALDVQGLPPEAMLQTVKQRFGALLDDGHRVLMLGGEHSITPAGVAAAVERYDELCVVQFDAHADLRDRYMGQRHSHACAMARCLELAPVRAIGVRSLSAEESSRIGAGTADYDVAYGWQLNDEVTVRRMLDGIAGRRVYLTFDVDYFDPSVIPATGTPEPGGGGWWPTLAILDSVFRDCDVVAADLVELAPVAGLHHADFAAARLAYKMVGFWARSMR